MKNFDELVYDYDRALEDAKNKLPNPLTHPNDRVQIAVIVDVPISIDDMMKGQKEVINDTVLFFEFYRNKKSNWVLNK